MWCITITSESGDDYGPHLFNREPTGDEIETFLKELAPCDWYDESDGPGFRGSYLHVSGPFEISVVEL